MDPQEQERSITDLEKKIDRLRALYDMYFMGIEKLEPLIPKKDVERHVAVLRKEGIRNTAQRFRFQQQVQRYSTLVTYWGRIARQIEEGTYRRDVKRAKARAEGGLEGGENEDVRATPVHEVDLSDFDDEEKTDPNMSLPDLGEPARPPPPPPPPSSAAPGQPSMAELLGTAAAAPTPAPPPAPRAARAVPPPRPDPAGRPAGLSDQRMQDIYRRFVAARASCNEPVKGLSFEKVREQLKAREASLVQKHGKAVDFEVTVKDGKAVLRAVPKGS